MKKSSMFVFALAVVTAMPAMGETIADAINRRLGVDLNAVSIGEFGKLTPKQSPELAMQKQLPQLQAPMKQELQANIQAPSKLAVVRKAHVCTLIPGRARRVARRELRQEAILQGRLGMGVTLLENPPPTGAGRTLLENSGAACSSCNGGLAVVPTTATPASTAMVTRARPAREADLQAEMPIRLTSITTRELLEGGQITRQVATVNEPGVCGGGGGGGRRGFFRR